MDETERHSERPWGRFIVLLDAPDHKVKQILVREGQRISLQRHQRRRERWTFVRGRAEATLDGRAHLFEVGQGCEIPAGCWHRVRNPGPGDLVFIEVQTGAYFGEDDIERAEDDYGRVS